MGHGTSLVPGHIEIDAHAWVSTCTGHRLEELTRTFEQFEDSLAQQVSTPLDALGLFVTARAGGDWVYAQDAVIAISPEASASVSTRTSRSACGDLGHHHVSLSTTVITYRYTDPQYGPVAFVEVLQPTVPAAAAPDRESAASSAAGPVAYADTAADSTWHQLGVQITCPAGHAWSLEGEQLLDLTASAATPAVAVDDLFPGGFVTDDTRIGAATHGEPVIACPICAEPCDVTLPGVA